MIAEASCRSLEADLNNIRAQLPSTQSNEMNAPATKLDSDSPSEKRLSQDSINLKLQHLQKEISERDLKITELQASLEQAAIDALKRQSIEVTPSKRMCI